MDGFGALPCAGEEDREGSSGGIEAESTSAAGGDAHTMCFVGEHGEISMEELESEDQRRRDPP